LAFYDTNARAWRAQTGTYDVMIVGQSAAEILLNGELLLARSVTAP
jgi:hypothetical protein